MKVLYSATRFTALILEISILLSFLSSKLSKLKVIFLQPGLLYSLVNDVLVELI
jgi:hypothetical protein